MWRHVPAVPALRDSGRWVPAARRAAGREEQEAPGSGTDSASETEVEGCDAHRTEGGSCKAPPSHLHLYLFTPQQNEHKHINRKWPGRAAALTAGPLAHAYRHRHTRARVRTRLQTHAHSCTHSHTHTTHRQKIHVLGSRKPNSFIDS